MRTLIAKKMRIDSASLSTTKSEFEKYLSVMKMTANLLIF
jgi:hypothetical protein